MSVLIKVSMNYDDEFNCREMKVMDDDDYANWTAAWERLLKTNSVEVSFGSNEFLTINDYDDFMQGLEVIEISSQEAKIFEKYFDDESWGTGGIFNFDDFDDEYYASDDDDDDIEPLKGYADFDESDHDSYED